MMSMLLSPVISKRLFFRSWSLTDISSIVNLFKDSELVFGQAPFPYTKDDAISWVNSMKEPSDVLNFAIEEKETKKVIGLYFISQINKNNNDCLIGYGFSALFRGKGYATESTKTIISYIQNTLGITHIRAETSDHNSGSHNVLMKTNFEIVKKLKNNTTNRFTKKSEDTWFWELDV